MNAATFSTSTDAPVVAVVVLTDRAMGRREGERRTTTALDLLSARREALVRRAQRAFLSVLLDGAPTATADDVRAAVELPPPGARCNSPRREWNPKMGRLSEILQNGDGERMFRVWDSTDAADAFAPLPAGIYVARIVSGELFTSKTNATPGYKLTFRVLEGEHAGRQFWLTEAALPMTKRGSTTFTRSKSSASTRRMSTRSHRLPLRLQALRLQAVRLQAVRLQAVRPARRYGRTWTRSRQKRHKAKGPTRRRVPCARRMRYPSRNASRMLPVRASVWRRLRRLAAQAGTPIDDGAFDKVRLFRAPNSRHPKTGRHKRRLTFDELLNLRTEAIVEQSAERALFGIPYPPYPRPQAVADWRDAGEELVLQAAALAECRATTTGPARLNRSTRDFMREGAPIGDRARALYSAARTLAEFGCPPELVHELLTEPALDSGLPPGEVRRQIDCGLNDLGTKGETR